MLEPFVVRYFRLGVEPVGKQPELFRGDFPRANSLEQMIEAEPTEDSAAGF
jgi:hypothetical protein